MRGSQDWSNQNNQGGQPVSQQNNIVQQTQMYNPVSQYNQQSMGNMPNQQSMQQDNYGQVEVLKGQQYVDPYRGNMPQEGQIRQPRVSNGGENMGLNPQNTTNTANSTEKKPKVFPFVIGTMLITIIIVAIVILILMKVGVVRFGKETTTETEVITEAVTELTTEYITTEMITETSTEVTTEALTEAIINEKDGFFGTDELGYVMIPEGYYVFQEENLEIPEGMVGISQVSDVTGTDIITLIAYNTSDLDTVYNQVIAAMTDEGFEILESTDKAGVYDAREISTYYADEGLYLDIYIFTTDRDNYVHYLAIEYLEDASNIAMYNATFTY